MAIQEGFNRYQCDVGKCTRRGYYSPGSQGAAGYVTKEYLDSNGNTQKIVLCTEHAAAFVKLMQAHDADVTAFLASGTVPSQAAAPATAATEGEE